MFWLGFVVGLSVVAVLLLAGFVVAACTAASRADSFTDFYKRDGPAMTKCVVCRLPIAVTSQGFWYHTRSARVGRHDHYAEPVWDNPVWKPSGKMRTWVGSVGDTQP